jgi:hypothetical protein
MRRVDEYLKRYGSGQVQMEVFCKHGNEPPSSMKCLEILRRLHNWRLLNKGEKSSSSRFWAHDYLHLLKPIVLI